MENEFYTFADYLSWDGTERMEIIDGEAVMMATPSRHHQKISGEIFRQMANYLDGKRCEVYHAPFAVRPFESGTTEPEDVDTVVEPDIAVICDPAKLDDYGCKGAPDLVIEVLSPSTARHDRVTKFGLYQRAGVREYWLVDPDEERVEVFLLRGGVFQAAETGTAGDALSVYVLDGCAVELGKVFGESG